MKREDEELVEAAMRDAKRSGAWFRMPCCFCLENDGHEDKKLSLGVNAATGLVRCFRCDYRGRLREAPMPGLAAVQVQLAMEDLPEVDPPDNFEPLGTEPGLSAHVFKAARAYLRARKVSQYAVRRLGIGACVSGWWENRIVVPIYNETRDVWVGYVGRLYRILQKEGGGMGTHRPPHMTQTLKYLYNKGFQRARVLYNAHVLAAPTDDPVLVVEGALDCCPLPDDSVAALGHLSKEQHEILRRSRRPIVGCFDGDAWRDSVALAGKLRIDGKRAGYIRLPPRMDPDDMPADWLKEEARRSLEKPL